MGVASDGPAVHDVDQNVIALRVGVTDICSSVEECLDLLNVTAVGGQTQDVVFDDVLMRIAGRGLLLPLKKLFG